MDGISFKFHANLVKQLITLMKQTNAQKTLIEGAEKKEKMSKNKSRNTHPPNPQRDRSTRGPRWRKMRVVLQSLFVRLFVSFFV